MKKEVILYIATSLDGYIARKDGGLDWLPQFGEDGEDYGYKDFLAQIGVVVMGNETYKMIQGFGGDYPYPGVDSYVFSRDESLKDDEHVKYVSGDVGEWLNKVEIPQSKKIWLVGGANLARDFMKADLVDKYIITVIPVLIGEGIPLFQGGYTDKKLKLVKSESWKTGLVQMTYST